jgi:DNA-directed RNA polymerase subunit RPC12/RpoP
MACPHCGSWSVKADRSLGGRMVCGRCGRPLGIGSQPRQLRRLTLTSAGRVWRWLTILLLLSALLAWLAEPPAQRPSPSPGNPGTGRRATLRW